MRSRLANLIAALKTRRILLGTLAVLLLVYALAGFFVVPRVARSQIEAFVGETLQRKISIGEIRFNPFTLAATIIDLRLTEADGAPLVAFQRLYLNVELSSLWRRGVAFKEIELAGPDVEVVITPEGSVNLAALAPPAPADAAPAPKKADAELLRVFIGRFAVDNGRVGFQDRSLAQPFSTSFAPIRFSLSDFSTEVGHRNAYSFAASSPVGARLEWTGGFTVQPLGSSGTFSLSDLRLTALNDYLEGKLPVEVVSGSMNLNGSYKFELRPLALEVILPLVGVRDLVLAERGVAGSPPVTIPEIDVRSVAFSLARRDVGVGRIEVRGARIEAVREEDGSLNLARLAPAPSASAAPAAAKPQAPWTVRADAIAIDGATVVAEDRSVSPAARMQLAPIGIKLEGLSTARAARMKLDAQVGIDGKGRLGVQGDFAADPIGATLAVDLRSFPLSALQPYLSQSTGMVLHSGNLGVQAKLGLAAARPGASPAVKVAADVRVDDLRVTDDLVKEDLVKWRSLQVSGIRFQQRPDRLAIERILAEVPYARVIIAQSGTTNLARAMTPAGGAKPAVGAAPAPKPSAAAAAPMQIAIKTVQVTDGSANFADYSIQPSFATGILALNGKVEGLSSAPDSRARVAISGKVDEYSPVEISGSVNLLSAAVHTDLAIDFRNIELTTFNPYSGKFAGYNISRGKLSTALNYRVDNRKLDAKHHVIVDNLEFGEQTNSKDAAPIPIKLGVALLKDRRGIIEFDLPVSGTLDDPQFSLMPMIWNGVVTLLTKLITAPFKALGGGSDGMQFVDFQPGSPALAEAEAKKLGALAKALVERPELRLNVPLTVATAPDGDAMARRALHALVPAMDPARPLDEAGKRKRIESLEAAYRAQLKAAPDYPGEVRGEEMPRLDARMAWLETALFEKLKPAAETLESLGRERAGSVRGALLANKDLKPERVFLVLKHVEAASAAGSVRMEMKLE